MAMSKQKVQHIVAATDSGGGENPDWWLAPTKLHCAEGVRVTKVPRELLQSWACVRAISILSLDLRFAGSRRVTHHLPLVRVCAKPMSGQ